MQVDHFFMPESTFGSLSTRFWISSNCGPSAWSLANEAKSFFVLSPTQPPPPSGEGAAVSEPSSALL